MIICRSDLSYFLEPIRFVRLSSCKTGSPGSKILIIGKMICIGHIYRFHHCFEANVPVIIHFDTSFFPFFSCHQNYTACSFIAINCQFFEFGSCPHLESVFCLACALSLIFIIHFFFLYCHYGIT